MNRFTEIDLEHWPRREQFLYYRTFENQLFNITLEFHVGKLHRFAKARGESFFLRTLHATLRAVDATPQMRMRVLDDGRLVEYEHLAALSPILRPDRRLDHIEKNLFSGFDILDPFFHHAGHIFLS